MRGLKTALKNAVAEAKKDYLSGKPGGGSAPVAKVEGYHVRVYQVPPRWLGQYLWVVKLYKGDTLLYKTRISQGHDWLMLESKITGELPSYMKPR